MFTSFSFDYTKWQPNSSVINVFRLWIPYTYKLEIALTAYYVATNVTKIVYFSQLLSWNISWQNQSSVCDMVNEILLLELTSFFFFFCKEVWEGKHLQSTKLNECYVQNWMSVNVFRYRLICKKYHNYRIIIHHRQNYS